MNQIIKILNGPIFGNQWPAGLMVLTVENSFINTIVRNTQHAGINFLIFTEAVFIASKTFYDGSNISNKSCISAVINAALLPDSIIYINIFYITYIIIIL